MGQIIAKSYVAVAACICLILIGCGGSHSTIPGGTCACPAAPPDMDVAERGANEIAVFAKPGVPTSTIPASGAEALALGQVTTPTSTIGFPILYVGRYPNTIAVLDFPYTKANATITAGINDPAAIAATTINGFEVLFVANRGANDVTIYEDGNSEGAFGSPTVTLEGLNAPDGLAIDAEGNLWAAQASSVVEFKPPFIGSSAPVLTITNGLKSPSGIAFDANGAMYVADKGKNTIVVYPVGSVTPSVTVTNGISGPSNLLIPAQANGYFSNDLFVPNVTNNTVAEFSLPLTSSSAPFAVNSVGMNEPSAITFLTIPQP